MQYLVHFTQGSAFMFLVIASLYFICSGTDRLRSFLGFVLLYGLFLHTVDFIFFTPRSHHVENTISVLCTTAIPLCAFILYEIIHPWSITWRVIFIHEFPCLLLVVIYIITFDDTIYLISLIYSILYSIIFATFLFFSIAKYHKRLKQEYSFTENLEFKWLWGILFLFVLFLTIWVYYSYKDDKIGRLVYYIGTSIIWTLIGYFINKHQKSLKTLQNAQLKSANECENKAIQPPPQVSEIEEGGLEEFKDSVQQYHFAEKLKYLFDKKEVYLDPKLTLVDVATELRTNRTYLSDYLNRILETTFFDYVNEYRLEYAAELLIKDLSLTLEQVAEQSGFNSLSTFRRSFSKRYSCTPHNYRKNPNILI